MKPIRVLAFLEAVDVTGPAKNLLDFAVQARSGCPDAVQVSVATFQRGKRETPFVEAARRAGVTVHAIPEAGAFDRAILARIRGLARESEPDLIQTHAVKSHFLVCATGLHRQTPWLAFHHGYTWPALRARLYNQLDRWSLPAARRVVTVSSAFRQELIKRGVRPERIEVVHNAIDPDWGRRGACSDGPALRAQLGIPRQSHVVLSVGRLSAEKDHRTLLAAMARVCRAVPGNRTPVHLLIVGDGPERAQIDQTIKALGLTGNVTLTGQVPSAEPYYGIADVAVLSSLTEGSPNALLEAMAARLPVVATRVGGILEIVLHSQSALLVEPQEEAALADAILTLLGDAGISEALIMQATQIVQAHHSPRARAQRLIEIYRRILADSGHAAHESG